MPVIPVLPLQQLHTDGTLHSVYKSITVKQSTNIKTEEIWFPCLRTMQ